MQNPKVSAMAKAFSEVDLDGHDMPPSPAPSSPRNGREYSIATQLVYSEGNDQYNASSTPIYQVRLLHIQAQFPLTYLVCNLQTDLRHRRRIRL